MFFHLLRFALPDIRGPQRSPGRYLIFTGGFMGMLDSLKSELIGAGLSQISATVGENESSVKKGIDALAPVLLSKVLGQASTSRGASELVDLVNSDAPGVTADSMHEAVSTAAKPSPSLANTIGGLLGGTSGISQIGNIVSSYSGLRGSSVERLIGIILPMILGRIRSVLPAQGSVSALMNLASNELPQIRSVLPSGIASNLGLIDAAKAVPEEIERQASGVGNWALPLLAALVLLGGLWAFSRRNASEPSGVATRTQAPEEDARAGLSRNIGADRITLRLPTGVEIVTSSGGAIDRFLKLVKGTSDVPARVEFDQVQFETDSSTITSVSTAQLRDLASVLKAYPSSEVRLTASAPATTDVSHNRQISEARAAAVKTYLAANGVSSDRIQTAALTDDILRSVGIASESRVPDRGVAVELLKR
jgi:outer membrane protein OmpA-like peptidoglycan-associated protein